MIVYPNNSIEIQSHRPNENWTGDTDIVAVEDGMELALKIQQYTPYFTRILDADGTLIDITPTEIPPEPPPGPTPIELIQEDNASLWCENMVQSAKVESNGTEVASLWYSLMMGGI